SYCLDEGRIALGEVDYVAFYDKPFLKFERLLETYLAFAPWGFRSFRMAIPLWLKEKLFQKQLLRDELRAFDPDFDWESRQSYFDYCTGLRMTNDDDGMHYDAHPGRGCFMPEYPAHASSWKQLGRNDHTFSTATLSPLEDRARLFVSAR